MSYLIFNFAHCFYQMYIKKLVHAYSTTFSFSILKFVKRKFPFRISNPFFENNFFFRVSFTFFENKNIYKLFKNFFPFPSEMGKNLKKIFHKRWAKIRQWFPTGFPTELFRRISRWKPPTGSPAGVSQSDGIFDGHIPSENPSNSVGLRRIFFCDELFPDDTFSVVISVGDPVFRRKHTLFPSLFPSQIRCIFVVEFKHNNMEITIRVSLYNRKTNFRKRDKMPYLLSRLHNKFNL